MCRFRIWVEQQAQALGAGFAICRRTTPTVVLSSPYLRAWHTAQIILAQMGESEHVHTFISDERLREKEFGVLDRLTTFRHRAKTSRAA
jgi:broad specificity phosphatase PhoE